MSRNSIVVKNLKKNFGNILALDDISFTVPSGSLHALLGPNGAGKSTALNILSCNLMPTEGDAEINGYSVKMHPDEVRRFIGICPQENVLYNHLTVWENLLFFGKMYEVPLVSLKARAEELITKVGLTEKKNAKVETLSGGQKRRVNLLAGLAHDPEIIFLDEPTAGLDPQTRRLLWDYIAELKTRGKTIILTTHYMDEADILSDRVGIIDHGKIIAEDSPEALKESIGKGDNLVFKLTGAPQKILSVLNSLLESRSISSASQLEGDEAAYRITAMDGIGKIGKLVNAFLEQKIQVEDISIRANSLENVFLTLTGRNLRD
jgi:ABC-2 type transport system ATP-binding protein